MTTNRFTRMTAAALSASVLLGGLVAPTMSPALAQNGATTTAVGSVTWGIQSSFLRYYTWDMFEYNTEPATDGATFNATSNEFTFPINPADSTVDLAAGTATLALAGAVHFQKHKNEQGGWDMDVLLHDLTVHVEGTQATITADTTTKGLVQNNTPIDEVKDDAVMATLTLPAPIGADNLTLPFEYVETNIPTTAGADIDPVLGDRGKYPAGTEIAPTDLVFAVTNDPDNTKPPVNPDAGAKPGLSMNAIIGLGMTGIILGIVAILGGLYAAVKGLIPGVSLPLPFELPF